MSRLTDAVARLRGGLLAVELGLKAVGEGAHRAADQLAEKIREFRDGGQGEEDERAAKH